MSNIKVLVVDDQRLIREGIASLLSIQKNIEVVGTADNGKSAIDMAIELHPDIIIMDIRMPVMDGIQSTHEIMKSGSKCQIIMLTTFDDDEYILKSLQAGAVGYLLKDIPPDDLAGAIRMAYHGIYQLSPTVTGRLIGNLVGRLDENSREETPVSTEIKQMVERLSDRERDVLRQLANGLTNREIADVLFITEGTVKNHVSNILSALNLRDRTQAALFASRIKI